MGKHEMKAIGGWIMQGAQGSGRRRLAHRDPQRGLFDCASNSRCRPPVLADGDDDEIGLTAWRRHGIAGSSPATCSAIVAPGLRDCPPALL